MFAGFDYGSSNCALGVMQEDNVRLLPLLQGKPLVPSCVYSLARELICETVARNLPDTARESYMAEREGPLRLAGMARRELDIAPQEQVFFMGHAALDEYMAMPEEGYFVKSPKSFLGASGLRAEHLAFFEDIVTVMMQTLKQAAEKSAGAEIEQTVIGRPVNFHGTGSDESNRQASDILLRSAKRAGFKDVELLFEPIAAGLDYETRLEQNQTVLVVDIGGGTSDCSMVRMGPDYRNKADRSADFLGHSGARVGGNDLDIHLAFHGFMPLFGSQDLLKTGRPLPTQPYWNAVTVNDLAAQADFYSREQRELLSDLLRDAEQPERLKRLLKMQANRQNYQLVRHAEQSKIALSDNAEYSADLNAFDPQLSASLQRDQFAEAVARPLQQMTELMREVVNQAGVQPDCVYITGGSAKSPVVQAAVAGLLGDVPVVDGDHFASVTAGLTHWASRCFA